MDDMVDIQHTALSSLGIVIPSHRGRVELLAKLLESLAAERVTFEQSVDVLVVDDSPVEEARQIAALCQQWSMRYERFQGNVSEKRNYGASRVQGDMLLFLDSDCEARPGLLAAHWRAYVRKQALACLGLVTFTGPENWLVRVIQETPLLAPFSSPLTSATVDWGPSANFSVRRTAFEAVGGFDERLSPPLTGGEDVDLGLRLTSTGGVIVTAPGAEVWHSSATWSDWRENIRRFITWGRGDYFLIKKHPHLAFQDMPAFLVTSGLIFVTALLIALLRLSLWPLLGGLLIPVVSAGIFGWLHPVHHASLYRRLSRSGGVLVLMLLDLGRLFEACRRREPEIVLRRFRFTREQLSEEWPDLVLTAWALLLAICLIGVLF